MTDVVFVFEVHQPHRLKRSLFWEGKVFKRLSKAELFDFRCIGAVAKKIFMLCLQREGRFSSSLGLLFRQQFSHLVVGKVLQLVQQLSCLGLALRCLRLQRFRYGSRGSGDGRRL